MAIQKDYFTKPYSQSLSFLKESYYINFTSTNTHPGPRVTQNDANRVGGGGDEQYFEGSETKIRYISKMKIVLS